MAVFGIIEADQTIQVGDKVRLFAGKSFISKGASAISTVELRADTAEAYITVSGASITSDDWFIDWVYTTAGAKTIGLRITQADATVTSFTLGVTVVTVATDNLFSDDDDLKSIQFDIMNWLPAGRSSWVFMHREAQKQILDYLNNTLTTNADGTRVTKSQIVDIQEVNDWSKFLVMSLIMQSISNQSDDIFKQKADYYQILSDKAKSKAVLRLDLDADGTIESGEKLDVRSGFVIRR